MTTRLFDGKLVPKTTEQVVKEAKRNRVNRVYYSNKFKESDIRDLGIIQVNEKAAYDHVALDESKNESIEFCGIDQKGSHFSLSTTVLSLYPNVDCPNIESRWRLASVNFTYLNQESGYRYSYSNEELVDYELKRQHSSKHESRNILKVGSMSIETVLPFSLSRILFNGVLTRTSQEGTEEKISAKFTISTHPTCDKFDYKYRFSAKYLRERLNETMKLNQGTVQPGELLSLVLEDRIDQTMMFQGHLELFDTNSSEKFIMWGAKMRRFINPCDALAEGSSTTRENLYAWSECGHWIHLTRPLGKPSLVYGFINNAYEYASHLHKASFTRGSIGPTSNGQPTVLNGSGLSQLDAFTSLQPDCKLTLVGYKRKEFTLEVLEVKEHGLMRILINSFEGWAMIGNRIVGNLGQALEAAQANLWTLSIEPEKRLLNFSNLASEKLLGGKGNSLIELNKLIKTNTIADVPSAVSVPKGLVVTCLAYRLWLLSDSKILNAIDELDSRRRALAARSFNQNPLSDDYVNLSQTQQILKDQCIRASTLLRSCPLPQTLRAHLQSKLLQLFTEKDLALGGDKSTGKLFAVRSSAVGEDSLETSAAGQMRTILDARGLDAICESIVDCWSSQFELEAITYKSQNGLPVNLPMAVVVQELIECHAAGVAATCDPLTGNKKQIQILANRGLGEGVVSGGKADTIDVSLDSMGWNATNESPLRPLSLGVDGHNIHKTIQDSSACCLTDAQIEALANLLINLRQGYENVKDREIEWGITVEQPVPSSSTASSSSSSSSSSSDADHDATTPEEAPKFHIHLLQSRPLTHLYKLSSREIDHELDYGFSGPLDIVSRANLGEVMPGALCPLTSSYFLTICPNVHHDKPFESNHTHKGFSATSFGFHGQLVSMILNHNDILSKFSFDEKDGEIMRMMIGTRENPKLKSLIRIEDLKRERMHPLSRIKRDNLAYLLALDMGGLDIRRRAHKRSFDRAQLEGDLTPIGSLVELLEKHIDEQGAMSGIRAPQWPFEMVNDPIKSMVMRSIEKLFDRICRVIHLLVDSWYDHMQGTGLSMVYNMISLKILEKQPAYAATAGEGSGTKTSEILNDFSLLVRGAKTESGDVSRLLDDLIVALENEGKLEHAKGMQLKELYSLLTSNLDKNAKSAKLYARFMSKNGHRAFKEFDFATLTWSDDPSYIIRSLASRLRQHSSLARESQQQKQTALEEKLKKDTSAILAKVVENRKLLTAFALPRARRAIARRERCKSRLILAVHRYRCAFRHLGGLLCLIGRLPNAELIFQMTIEEVDRVIHGDVSDLAGILYKARRRQQRARVLNQITFSEPVLDFADMVETVRRVSEGLGVDEQVSKELDGGADHANADNVVRGMTSCAGYVTGRACVVSSPDDMDQIQPNDILITYSIDTSWSVYFFILGGIVTEVGGIVSHGAVVAREYGIPTLCTAIGACSKFKTGQMITLDANRGICYLAKGGDDEEANGDE